MWSLRVTGHWTDGIAAHNWVMPSVLKYMQGARQMMRCTASIGIRVYIIPYKEGDAAFTRVSYVRRRDECHGRVFSSMKCITPVH